MSATAFTYAKLSDVEDSARKFGLPDEQQSRFARTDLNAEDTGVSLHHFAAGHRQTFGHKHDKAEEVYVVLSGSGRMKLDDEIIELEALDAVRVAPPVTRAFEAGDDGLQVLAFGPHCPKDGDMVQGWWSENGG